MPVEAAGAAGLGIVSNVWYSGFKQFYLILSWLFYLVLLVFTTYLSAWPLIDVLMANSFLLVLTRFYYLIISLALMCLWQT